MSRGKLTSVDIGKMSLLFKEGVRPNQIAQKFHIDHSTVYYHLKKLHLVSVKVISKTRQKKKKYKYELEADREPINQGKNYEDYIDAEESKRLQRQAECLHKKKIVTVRCSCCGLVEREQVVVK